MNSPKQGVSNLPEICFRHGMRRVVISPGSRNAPLIFSFTGQGKLECLSITDERSAAYFALGLALQSQQPVGLICTSGTALLNYAPAIAEALYQNVPLIIMTADRPSEWIDQEDGQTIRQHEIYRNYIKRSFSLPLETVSESDLWYFNRTVNEALNCALLEPRGPVHLNIPLREPLYNPLPAPQVDLRMIKTNDPDIRVSDKDLAQLQSIWNKSGKKMVIFGADQKNDARLKIVPLLLADPAVVIIAENISNVENELIIASPERFFATITGDEGSTFRPDLLITIGHSVVSGRLKKYLRQNPPGEHWHIQPSPSFVDTFQGLTRSIIASPETVVISLTENATAKNSHYRDLLLKREMELREKQRGLMRGFPFSDLVVFEAILKRLPAGSNLHLANSTPVRYSQLFAGNGDIQYHCNRGTSGIDGCISTAAGYAVASQNTTILIAGDISFIYDSNGLWNKYLKGNFKIIVINNGGGNIFSLINPVEGDFPAREFLETPHHITIKFLTEAYGANHAVCQSHEELPGLLDWFLEPADHPYILEIVTDPEINTTVFKDYYKQIKSR